MLHNLWISALLSLTPAFASAPPVNYECAAGQIKDAQASPPRCLIQVNPCRGGFTLSADAKTCVGPQANGACPEGTTGVPGQNLCQGAASAKQSDCPAGAQPVVETNRCWRPAIDVCAQFPGATYRAADRKCVIDPCLSLPGFRFDSAQGVCVKSVDSTHECDAGALLNEQGECVVKEPGSVYCAGAGAVYDEATRSCKQEAEDPCPGGRYDEVAQTCLVEKELVADCPQDTVYNAESKACEKRGYLSCPGGGTPNAQSLQCEADAITPTCPSGGQYDESVSACTVAPTASTCPNGYAFTASKKSCVFAVKLECPAGYNTISTKRGVFRRCVLDKATFAGLCGPNLKVFPRGTTLRCISDVAPQLLCKNGKAPVNGKCEAGRPKRVCATDQKLAKVGRDWVCVTAAPDCPAPAKRNKKGVCVKPRRVVARACEVGTKKGNQCVAPRAQTCASGFVLDGTVCARNANLP